MQAEFRNVPGDFPSVPVHPCLILSWLELGGGGPFFWSLGSSALPECDVGCVGQTQVERAGLLEAASVDFNSVKYLFLSIYIISILLDYIVVD